MALCDTYHEARLHGDVWHIDTISQVTSCRVYSEGQSTHLSHTLVEREGRLDKQAYMGGSVASCKQNTIAWINGSSKSE